MTTVTFELGGRRIALLEAFIITFYNTTLMHDEDRKPVMVEMLREIFGDSFEYLSEIPTLYRYINHSLLVLDTEYDPTSEDYRNASITRVRTGVEEYLRCEKGLIANVYIFR